MQVQAERYILEMFGNSMAIFGYLVRIEGISFQIIQQKDFPLILQNSGGGNYAVSWYDSKGSMWLFGGKRSDNGLWKLNPFNG